MGSFSSFIFSHNLGKAALKTAPGGKGRKKLVNTGSHRTVSCIRLKSDLDSHSPISLCGDSAQSSGNFMKLLPVCLSAVWPTI